MLVEYFPFMLRFSKHSQTSVTKVLETLSDLISSKLFQLRQWRDFLEPSLVWRI